MPNERLSKLIRDVPRTDRTYIALDILRRPLGNEASDLVLPQQWVEKPHRTPEQTLVQALLTDAIDVLMSSVDPRTGPWHHKHTNQEAAEVWSWIWGDPCIHPGSRRVDRSKEFKPPKYLPPAYARNNAGHVTCEICRSGTSHGYSFARACEILGHDTEIMRGSILKAYRELKARTSAFLRS